MPVEHLLEAIPPLLVYVVVGLVIGVESLGIPLPGEIVLVSASLLASQHDELNPLWIGVWASAGAIIGDSIGYAIGRKGGPRLFAWMGRKFPKHFGPQHIEKARDVFDRRGAWAVFFGRFVALLRILAGPLAGSLHMNYGKFLVANATGGIVWAGGTTAAVYYLGIVAEQWLKRFSYAGLIIAVVVGVITTVVIRRRLARSHSASADAASADTSGSGPAEPETVPARD
ncbi:membrane protein [Lentzea sp. NBRC 105346]|uniref:DedA family protein n=1 Tax=Lentzea sp. NBRC 105346 TaxID=3032205 RepID=UPI0024A5D57D|nr:DedA family protein [Lentzea sp. NBRC 105346]GLZ36363.1 membrane protein [Lentzea sp. NBRC 105346]